MDVNSIVPSTSSRMKRKKSTKKMTSDNTKRLKISSDRILCDPCQIQVHKSLMHAHRRSNEHKHKCSVAYKQNNIDVIRTAFKSRVNTYRVNNMISDELSIENFLKHITESVTMLINENLQTHTSIKVNVELFGGYMVEKGDEYKYDVKSFNTKNEIITLSTELNNVYKDWIHIIKTKAEDFNDRESGWHLIEIHYLEVNINHYNPFRGSTYIKLPKTIENRKAVVNVKNNDNECFGHAIISAMRPVEHNVDHVSSYPPFRSVLNFKDIEFPMNVSDIHKFERQNCISVNVFGLNYKKDKVMGPLHHTKQRQPIHINLLFIEEGDKSHFCWIKNLSRLLSKQLSANTRRKYICDGCLQYFMKADLLHEHQLNGCGQVKTILPFGGE